MSESLKKIPAEKLEALEETMAAFGQAAPPDWFDGSPLELASTVRMTIIDGEIVWQQ